MAWVDAGCVDCHLRGLSSRWPPAVCQVLAVRARERNHASVELNTRPRCSVELIGNRNGIDRERLGSWFRAIVRHVPVDLERATRRFPGGAYALSPNIPTMTAKVRLFRELARVLTREGRTIDLVSSPEIYVHDWASFSTAGFPENKNAKSGDVVRIINTAIEDSRPVEDVLWTNESYRGHSRVPGWPLSERTRRWGEKTGRSLGSMRRGLLPGSSTSLRRRRHDRSLDRRPWS